MRTRRRCKKVEDQMVISIKLDRDRSYHPKCRFISESTIFSCKVITWNYLLYWLHSINWKSTALNIPPPTRSTWILLHQSSPHLGFVWFHKYLFVVALTSLSRRGVKVEAQRVFILKKHGFCCRWTPTFDAEFWFLQRFTVAGLKNPFPLIDKIKPNH